MLLLYDLFCRKVVAGAQALVERWQESSLGCERLEGCQYTSALPVKTFGVQKTIATVLAPVRNDRRSAGKTTAVSAGLIVSTHEDRLVGNTGAVRFRVQMFRYKVATLPTPSSSTGAMKAGVVGDGLNRLDRHVGSPGN